MSDLPTKTTGKKASGSRADPELGAESNPEASAEAGVAAKAEALRMLQLMWAPSTPPTSPARGPKPRINLDQIVETAVHLADEHGQDALSMRRVASELKVSVMSLYTYVTSKTELLELMVDRVLGERQPADPASAWRDRARAWAIDRWGLLRRHTWILDQSLYRFSWGPNAMDADEELISALDAAGLKARHTVECSLAIHAYVNGAAYSSQVEHRAEQASGTSLFEHHVARSVFYETYYEESRFPATTKIYLAGGYDEFSLDPFLFGLERLLDGIEALLGSQGSLLG